MLVERVATLESGLATMGHGLAGPRTEASKDEGLAFLDGGIRLRLQAGKGNRVVRQGQVRSGAAG